MHKKGFTLVEMIVALGIFSIVAVVAIGALAKVINANKKAQTIQAAVSNLSYAMETMSRELRVGRNYQCNSDFHTIPASANQNTTSPQSCNITDSDDSFLSFESSRTAGTPPSECNLVYIYRFKLESGSYVLKKAHKTSCNSVINDNNSSNGNANFDNIISSNVKITGYSLKVIYDANHPYPIAIVRLSGYAGLREKDRTYFDLETAVSQNL